MLAAQSDCLSLNPHTHMVERKLAPENALSGLRMPRCTSIHTHAHMYARTENKAELKKKKQISNSHPTLKPLWTALRN